MAGAGTHPERDIAPYREYHARRSREQLERREALRLQCLETVKTAIRRHAPAFEPVRAVYLLGSVLQPGRFTRRSDVDVAIECDDITVETPFCRALEDELRRNVDLRPLEGRLTWAVEHSGERVYEREG